jgi:O-antigen/teichoic acid export membrane protein
MSDKLTSVGPRLVSGSVLRVTGLVASAIVAVFLMPFVVRHLGDRLYGFWALASSFIGYYVLLDLGLSSAVSQYLCIAIGRNDPVECRQVCNTALRVNLLLGAAALVATAAIVAVTPWFSHNAGDTRVFREAIAILGLGAALNFPARVYAGVLDALYRFDISSWLVILGLVLRTALVVGALFLGGGLVALAWMTLIATLPVMLLQVWFARREAAWARIEIGLANAYRVKSFFSYGLYTLLTYLADILRFQVDPLVISNLIGLAAVTHYRVAGVFAQYFLQILILSLGILQPVFSRLHGAGNRAVIETLFLFGTKLSCCISVFICLALIAWGKPFIDRWMGTPYGDAYPPLVVLSLAVMLDVCQKPSIDLLYATFKHRFYAYANWAEGALNLAFSLALARRYGILGVAMGTLIGAFVARVLVLPWWVCRVSGFQYGKYMKSLAKNLLYCTGIMSLATIAVAWGLKPSYPMLIASATCVTGIYAVGCWLIVLNPSEREQLLTAVSGLRDKKMESTAAGAAL